MQQYNKIPFTVIGGYLGAGKTTLLNHILRNNKGRRFALLINDFGQINIDANLVESRSEDTIRLGNGCICCTMAAGFVVALNKLLTQDPLPEHIIVEASGVSDPIKIAHYGQTPAFSLDGILIVVDAETIQAKAQDKFVGRTIIHQLQNADLLILNKTDLLSKQNLGHVTKWLAHIAPQSRIIEAQYGNVPRDLLLGTASTHHRIDMLEDDDPDHAHHPTYTSCSFVETQPLSGSVFEQAVKQLPTSIIRSKGIVYLAEEPDYQMIFQLVGNRWQLQRGPAWKQNERPKTTLVFISLRDVFDPAMLNDTFSALTNLKHVT